MIYDLVGCNDCGTKAIVEYHQDICPACKSTGNLFDIEQTIREGE